MINKENYEEYMLLYADGELSDAETKALLAFVDANPELRGELEAYCATRLVPDTQMVYAHKEQLMKASGGGRIIGFGKWWMYAAAACVILFAVMIFRKNDNSVPVVATNSKSPISNPNTTQSQIKEELHSIPQNPVAHENTIVKSKTKSQKSKVVPLQKEEVQLVKKEEPQQVIPQQEPVTQPKQEETVVAQNETKPVTVEEEPSAKTLTTQAEKKRKGLLAWLPINTEKKEGVEVLAQAVSEKLEKVKEVKNNIKDSDVRVRIGNTELFVVRL